MSRNYLETLIGIGDDIGLDDFLGELSSDTRSRTIDAYALLLKAVDDEKIECVRVLVKHGADINKFFKDQFYENYTCLAFACHYYSKNLYKRNYAKIIIYLVESGADCNLREPGTDNALMSLCGPKTLKGCNIPELKSLIQLLVNHGAKRDDELNSRGKTAEGIARLLGHDCIADFVRDCQPDIVETKGVHCDDLK